MKKAHLYITIIFSVYGYFLFSQEANSLSKTSPLKHEIGVFASLDSGLGFSFRSTLERHENIKIQVSLLYFPANFGSGIIHGLILGGSGQYVFYKPRVIEFYSYVGGQMYAYLNDLNESTLLLGTGLGINISLFKRMKIQLQSGLAFQVTDTDNLTSLNNRKVMFSPGIGIMFGLGKLDN